MKRDSRNLEPAFRPALYRIRESGLRRQKELNLRRGRRSHSQRFCDVALTVKFHCDYDVAKSLRMGPIDIDDGRLRSALVIKVLDTTRTCKCLRYSSG